MSVSWGQDTIVKFLGGQIRIRLSGSKSQEDYNRDLNGIIARSQNMTPVMVQILEYLMGSVSRTFDAQGRPAKWSPLAAVTIQDRLRKGFGPGPILQRTRRLLNSLTERGHPNQRVRIGPRSVSFTSTLVYFKTHQFGDPSRNIPQRIMLIFQAQDKAQITRIVNRFILEGKT